MHVAGHRAPSHMPQNTYSVRVCAYVCACAMHEHSCGAIGNRLVNLPQGENKIR